MDATNFPSTTAAEATDIITVQVDDGFSRWDVKFTDAMEAARYVAACEHTLWVLNDIKAAHRWTKAELRELASQDVRVAA